MSHSQLVELKTRIHELLEQIYPHAEQERLVEQLLEAIELSDGCQLPRTPDGLWDQSDVALITYGNSVSQDGEVPLETLRRFLNERLESSISILHILPFFPYSSDDGFSVIDYTQVNQGLGDWRNISLLARDYRLMSDLVINHCSSRSQWFDQFKRNRLPGRDYFFTAAPEQDLSMVVRPRTSPLLREVETPDGTKHVWCTFSHDQVDLNFANPDVLLEFVRIICFYLKRGVRVFRLDAIAFLWKEIGTDCLNHPTTHAIVRLLRLLIEHHTADALIITETNIPNRENLAYFGNGNEAHLIYNFSLPPLLVYTLTSGNSHYLKNWMMSMPPAQLGTTYFNFIASHDGIGLRPAEGLLSEEEIAQLVLTMEGFGGKISWRALDDGENKPYEINIALYDALRGTIAQGPDAWQQERFLCAHTIMLALEGIPAFYIHSLLATQNDQERVETTGNNRSINRHLWEEEKLTQLLDQDTHHARVLQHLKTIIEIRKRQRAFHPNATQFTLHMDNALFGFWRQSIGREQSIFCISNISDSPQSLLLADINLIMTDEWSDLLSGVMYDDLHQTLELAPYQSVWLTNRAY